MSSRRQRSVWLQDLRWPEVQDYLETCDVILVPIGATEQHGHHLPLSIDTGWASAAAALAAAKESVLVAPPLAYGWSTHHMGYPGTVTLRADTLRLMATDIANSLIHHGFRRIVFVNGNRIANLPPLEIATVQIKNRTGAFVGIADTGLIAKTEVEALCTVADGGLDHAGEAESAFGLYWRGENVDMTAATRPNRQKSASESAFHYPIELDPARSGNSVSYAVSPDEHRLATAPSGSTADSLQATAEQGHKMVEAIATNIAVFIGEVKKYPLGKVRAEGIPL